MKSVYPSLPCPNSPKACSKLYFRLWVRTAALFTSIFLLTFTPTRPTDPILRVDRISKSIPMKRLLSRQMVDLLRLEGGGREDKLEELLAWAHRVGCTLDKLRLEYTEDRGVRMIATQDIQPKDQICSIPETLCISVEMGLNTNLAKTWNEAFNSHKCQGGMNEGLSLASNAESSHVIFWLFLSVLRRKFLNRLPKEHEGAEEALKMDLEPYFHALPQTYSDLMWWSDSELDLLRPTQIYTNARRARKGLRMIYDQVMEYVIPRYPPLKGLSYDEFKWGWSTHRSRSFGDRKLLRGNQSHFLMPLLDFANHNASSKLEWVTNVHDIPPGEKGRISYVSGDVIPKGEEIFTSYGRKGNDMLLSGYGFVETDNCIERFPLQEEIPADLSRPKNDAIARARLEATMNKSLKLSLAWYLKVICLPSPSDYFFDEDIFPTFGKICKCWRSFLSPMLERAVFVMLNRQLDIKSLKRVLGAWRILLDYTYMYRDKRLDLEPKDVCSNSSLSSYQGGDWHLWAAGVYMNTHIRVLKHSIRNTTQHLRKAIITHMESRPSTIFRVSIPCMPSPSSADQNYFNHVNSLPNSYIHPALLSAPVKSLENSNLLINSAPDVDIGTPLLIIPQDSVINMDLVQRSSEIPWRVSEISMPGGSVSEEDMLALYLIENYHKGNTSEIAPFLSALPLPSTLPLYNFFAKLEINSSATVSNFPPTAAMRLQQIIVRVLNLYEGLIRPLSESFPVDFSLDKYSKPMLAWAQTIVSLFSFPTASPPPPEQSMRIPSEVKGGGLVNILPLPLGVMSQFPIVSCEFEEGKENRVYVRSSLRRDDLMNLTARNRFERYDFGWVEETPLDNTRRLLLFGELSTNLLTDFAELSRESILERAKINITRFSEPKKWLVKEHMNKMADTTTHLFRRWNTRSPFSRALLELLQICKLTDEEAQTLVDNGGLWKLEIGRKAWSTLFDVLWQLEKELAPTENDKKAEKGSWEEGIRLLRAEHLEIIRFAREAAFEQERLVTSRLFRSCGCPENYTYVHSINGVPTFKPTCPRCSSMRGSVHASMGSEQDKTLDQNWLDGLDQLMSETKI